MGGMNPMQGPSAPGMGHGGPSMFSNSGFGCIRGDLVCPQWCLVVDANGCKSCPCGPAGGMNAMAGGPASNPMAMVMASMGGGGGAVGGGAMMGGMPTGHGGPNGNLFTSGMSGGNAAGHSTNQCIGTKLCMEGCTGQYELGPVGSDGCQTCSCRSSTVSGSSMTVVGHESSHCTECTETKPVTNTQIVYVKPSVTYVTKPIKECTATLLCASTCESGYQLGSTDTGGCRSCRCPAKHQVSTTTVHYYTQIVAPATKECTHTAHCMSSCESGYHMSTTDTHNCPVCNCVQVEKPYQYPIEIAVEPPPERTYEKPYQYPIEIAVEPPPNRPQYAITFSVSCSSALSCNTACSVGYKCGVDKCPTCECIHPSVVGMTTIEHVHIERPVVCSTALQCPDSCSLGYKCGPDGCPTCECLVAVTTTYQQVRPQYTLQTCSHTLTCATTCTNGYELVTDGSGGCQKCVCKQPVYETHHAVYAVQRPQPQYAIVDCPSTDYCASECPHGHEIVRMDGKCPECRCLQGSSTGGSQMFALSGGGSPGIGQYGGSGGMSYSIGGSSYCPPLPPDCHPSCIVYDDPHCRRCRCQMHVK